MESLSITKYLYIFTKRRARIEGVSKYVELIPKLFGDLYMNRQIDIPRFIQSKKEGVSNRDLFISILTDPLNNLFKTEYISEEDRHKIIEINLRLYDENNKDNLFNSFLEHLYSAHGDMKYGIYYSLVYAEDDIDFSRKFQDRLNITNKNDRIIQYMKFDIFLEHIKEINRKYQFNSKILYTNPVWYYGKISTESVIIDTPCSDLNIDLFNKNIKIKYPNNSHQLEQVELICELPLDSIFKFFYVSTYNKYLKYKNKYLELKIGGMWRTPFSNATPSTESILSTVESSLVGTATAALKSSLTDAAAAAAAAAIAATEPTMLAVKSSLTNAATAVVAATEPTMLAVKSSITDAATAATAAIAATEPTMLAVKSSITDAAAATVSAVKSSISATAAAVESTLKELSVRYQMLNYHYIYYIECNDDQTIDKLTKLSIDNDIYQIIYKYSYPSCLTQHLDKTEQFEIINDEYKFILYKIAEYSLSIKTKCNIKLIQIPRIIYDLFNLHNQLLDFRNIKIYLDLNNKLNFDSYKRQLFDYQVSCIENIIQLNNLFYEKYKTLLFDWFAIMIDILENIKKIPELPGITNRFGNYYAIYLVFIKDNFIRATQILIKTLNLELGITTSNTDKTKIIIYRGADSTIEDIFRQTEFIYSISYNSSILNGILGDTTACTFVYFSKNNYKNYYIVNKHFYNDNSPESLLLFIPPIHPYLLLNFFGEFWHIRSKIPKNSKLRVSGFISGVYSIEGVPDYLLSNEEESILHLILKQFVISNKFEVIEQTFIKYLKYKNKYENLKNLIG